MTKTGHSPAYEAMTEVLAFENALRAKRNVAIQARARKSEATRTLVRVTRTIQFLKKRLARAKKRYKDAKSKEQRAERLARAAARKTKA